MAITTFVSTVWGESLLRSLNKNYVSVANCTREYEGDIREMGATVRVLGLNNVTVKDYTKNADMSAPEELDDFTTLLKINNAKYFNFQIDDIDRVQSKPELMEAALQNASRALADEADRVVYEVCRASQNNYEPSEKVTPETIVREILKAHTLFCNQCGYNPSDVVLEVSPRIAAMIVEAKMNLLTNNTNTVENGYLGSIGGCKIYVSTKIYSRLNGSDIWTHDCIMRTKRAVAFAEQISEIEAYRPERRFADAVKGLHLYGCAPIHENELLVVSIPADQDGEQI